MAGKFVLRSSNDTQNPIAARLYDIGITAGRGVSYLANAIGNRTAFLAVLSQGARGVGDTGCHRAIKVLYAGFELPQYDSNGSPNWVFHDGRIPKLPTYLTCTATASTDRINRAAHPYNNDDPIAFIKRGTASIGEPLEAHKKYFVVNKATNDFQVSETLGGAAIPITANSSGTVHVYKADAGFFDVHQGRSTFFPHIDDTFAGLCYLEVLLPAELSNGEDEPTKLKVILDGKLVYDYELDENDELVKLAPVPSKNNALIALDVMTNDAGLPLSRFGGVSTLQWRDRCAEKIAWIGGNDAPATPDSFDNVAAGLVYDGLGKLTKTASGSTALIARSLATPKRNISIEAVYNGGDCYLQFSSNGTTPTHGVKIESGVLYYYNGGSPEVLADCFPSDRIRIAFEYEFFKVYRNGVPVPLDNISIADQPAGNIYLLAAIATQNAYLSDIRLLPVGTNAVPRQVDRFNGGVVILAKTPCVEVFETEVALSAGVSWQDVDGKVEFLTTPDRTPVMTLNADANSSNPCNLSRCTVKPRAASANPNVWQYGYRDRDDEILTKKYIFVDRPERRAAVGYIPSGLIEYGVMTQSQIERIGETNARLKNDCDLTWTCEGFLDSLELAKGDFAWLVDDASGFPDESPAKVMVLSELNLPNGEVENRRFEVTIITDDFYSDTEHGKVTPLIHNHFELKYVAPPPAASLTLQELVKGFDGTSASVIDGEIEFNQSVGQYARIFLRKLNDDGVTWGSWRETTIVVECNPNTLTGGFQIDPVEVGTYEVKAVTYSAGGVTGNFEAQITEEIEISGDLTTPEPPTTLEALYDGLKLNWKFAASVSANVKGYQIRDEGNRIVKELVTGLAFDESVQTSTVTRRVYAVSRVGVLSTDYAALTFTVPPSISWVSLVGGAVQSDNTFKQSAAAGFGNSGATFSSAFVRAGQKIALAHICDNSNTQRAFGLSAKKVNSALADLDFGFKLNADGTAKVIEGGSEVFSIASYAAEDRFYLEVETGGAVKYYRGNRVDPSETPTPLYTSGATASRGIYYAACLISTANASFGNRNDLDGFLFPTFGANPHYNNFTRCALDVVTGNVTGGGLSAWDTSGASSLESIAADNDASLEFSFAQNNKACSIGFNTSDTDQHLDSIPFALYAKADNSFAVRHNSTDLATGSYTNTDKFQLVRIGANVYAFKNGVQIYSGTASANTVTGLLIVDMAFYDNGTINAIAYGRRASGGISFGTTRPQARVGNATTPADSLSGRTVGTISDDNKVRAGDNTAPITTGVTLSIPYQKAEVDGTGDIKFQLNVAVPALNYLNFGSTGRIRIRILDKFGSIVKVFEPMTFAAAGGLVSMLSYASKYAYPIEEAIIAVSFENAYGWSKELFIYKGTNYQAQPTAESVLLTPLELALEVNQPTLNLTWQNPSSGNTTKTVRWRKLGASAWSSVTGVSSSVTTYILDASNGILANTWYETQVVNDGHESNIALIFTTAKINVSYPAVDSISGGLSSGGTDAEVSWVAPSGASGITSYKVYRGTTLVQNTLTLSFSEAIAADTTNTYTVVVVYGANESPSSSPVSVYRPPLPAANDPSNLQIIASSQRRLDLTWNLNGNTNMPVLAWNSVYGSDSVNLTVGQESYALLDLEPNTYYELSLTAGSGVTYTSGWTQPAYSGGGGYCFLGYFEVMRANGDGLSFEWIYQNQAEAFAIPIRSFDRNNNLFEDFIDSISKNTEYEYIEVLFAGDSAPLCVTPRHRFYTELRRFIEIGQMKAGETVFQIDNSDAPELALVAIETIKLISAPEGIEVYNIRTKRYKHYFVQFGNLIKPKAVHNRKDDSDPFYQF